MTEKRRYIIGGWSNKDNPVLSNVISYLHELPTDRKFVVEIKPYRKVRSIEQNSFIHAVPLKLICEQTGYDIEEIKEYLCGEYTGWDTKEMFGKTVVRPVKTTSQMKTDEMAGFITFMQRWAAENLGLIIPDPNEWIT